jgi:hypothetical protein
MFYKYVNMSGQRGDHCGGHSAGYLHKDHGSVAPLLPNKHLLFTHLASTVLALSLPFAWYKTSFWGSILLQGRHGHHPWRWPYKRTEDYVEWPSGPNRVSFTIWRRATKCCSLHLGRPPWSRSLVTLLVEWWWWEASWFTPLTISTEIICNY